MARRQDSGSTSAHENVQPHPHNEDRLPENTDQARGRGEADDELEEDEETREDEEEEGA